MTETRRAPKEEYVPAGRALHLIDIENLMGGPNADMVLLRWALAGYLDTATVTDEDHVIIGSNPFLWPYVHTCRPSARLVGRPGRHGADIALIEAVLNTRFITARYDRIVIGSGDGAFTYVAEVYIAGGLRVEVVSRRPSLSYDLAATTSTVRFLAEPDVDLAA